MKSMVEFAHTLLTGVLTPGDIAVDCTMGNGNDTLFLARIVGAGGHVFAFDIQGAAIEKTGEHLARSGLAAGGVTLIQAGHQSLNQHIPAQMLIRCKAAIFNLGYLPGADKRVCTTPETTIPAIEALLAGISPGGLIVIVVYPGHPEGARESDELLRFCADIRPEVADVVTYQVINNRNRPPYLIAIEKNSRA
ncbi:MAG: hypothetical protein FWE32_07465 [Oscillospiraceae bacterium]|nr:hypothetical protein [Oscillospiraceae bacterium]